MTPSSLLVEAIAARLPAPPARCLLVGQPALAAALGARVPSLVAAASGSGARRPRAIPGLPPLVRARPDLLPFPDGVMDVVVAADVLGPADDRAAALSEWRRLLRPGRLLIVAEPLPGGGVLRALGGLLGKGRRRVPPEELTGMLLNAELRGIRQDWLQGWVLTLGSRFPG